VQLIAIVGQYLLLSFVLPGFCYLLVFALCFPGGFNRIHTALLTGEKQDDGDGQSKHGEEGKSKHEKEGDDDKKDGSVGSWMLLGSVFGLLLSSVTFAIEILLRNWANFDCDLFPIIPFHELGDRSQFFTAEAFMHFNIGVGIFILFVIFAIYVGRRLAEWISPRKPYGIPPLCLAGGLIVLAAANTGVSGYLFNRVTNIVYGEKADTMKDQCKRQRHLVWEAQPSSGSWSPPV
jgi:hypothetical protein